MKDGELLRARRLDLAFAPKPWRWAEDEAERIDTHWATIHARNPALFDGRVLLLHTGALEGDVFRGAYLETRFSRFIAWRDFGFPDTTLRNCFAMAGLRAEDGGWLLGVMGAHTANAGKAYFPAGTPDPLIRQLNTELTAVAKEPAVLDRLSQLGALTRPNTVEEFAAFREQQIAFFADMVKRADIRID